MQNYGIRGVALSWFRNYLSNRNQFVSINGTNSGLLPIKCGVPQGSILGPLLFLIYINDLPSSTNATTILFADDTNAIYIDKSYNDLINLVNNDLVKFSEWFKGNKMAVNESKTKFIVFHKKHDVVPAVFPIELNGIFLERVPSIKFLGVMINENLEWSTHINYVCAKVSKSTAILAKLKHYIPKFVLKIIYQSLCISHMTYAVTVWGGSSKTQLNRLRVMQKKGIRHVCNARFNSHTEPLFKECQMLTFDDLYKLNCVKLMYKKSKDLIHKYHASQLIAKSERHDTLTRQAYDIIIRGNKHSRLHKINSLNYKTGTHWNALPFQIKQKSMTIKKPNIGAFTRAAKFHYLSKYTINNKCKNKHCYSCNA